MENRIEQFSDDGDSAHDEYFCDCEHECESDEELTFDPYHNCLLQGCEFIDRARYHDEHFYIVVFHIPLEQFIIRNRCDFEPSTDLLKATGFLNGAYRALEYLEYGDRLLGQFN